jgi:hypothetical protein
MTPGAGQAWAERQAQSRASTTRTVLIVAARVALAGDSSADQVEDLADDIDRRLSERLPVTPYVFIDPTQTAAADGDRGRAARRARSRRI